MRGTTEFMELFLSCLCGSESLRQAKALKREGYKTPRKGKPPKTVTVKEIQSRFSLGQAGVILRMMRTKKAKGKQSWQDTVPERPFLGVTPEKAEAMNDALAERILAQTKKK